MKTYMIQDSVATILVFQTNVESEIQLEKLSQVLNSSSAIQKWNLDQQDVDKVLRIVSDTLNADDVVKLLGNAGFFCAELPD